MDLRSQAEINEPIQNNIDGPVDETIQEPIAKQTHDKQLENKLEIEQQANYIFQNNDKILAQRKCMIELNDCLEKQQQTYEDNKKLLENVVKDINEYIATFTYLQQQIYYQRRELDQLAEQQQNYQEEIQKQQQTIKEQQEQIENNTNILAYDKKMLRIYGIALKPYL